MFDFFKRKAKPSATATDESKPLWVELFDTQPVDSEGSIIALDDLVSYRGTLLQVVAMSHKQKVVLRTPGKKKGGFWVASHNCTLVKRHARKEN